MVKFTSDNLLLIVFVCGVLILVTVIFILGFRQCKKYKEEHPGDREAEIEKMFIDPESVTTTVKATVIDMACSAEMIGTKTPKAVR